MNVNSPVRCLFQNPNCKPLQRRYTAPILFYLWNSFLQLNHRPARMPYPEPQAMTIVPFHNGIRKSSYVYPLTRSPPRKSKPRGSWFICLPEFSDRIPQDGVHGLNATIQVCRIGDGDPERTARRVQTRHECIHGRLLEQRDRRPVELQVWIGREDWPGCGGKCHMDGLLDGVFFAFLFASLIWRIAWARLPADTWQGRLWKAGVRAGSAPMTQLFEGSFLESLVMRKWVPENLLLYEMCISVRALKF